jgi:hypothetical protein
LDRASARISAHGLGTVQDTEIRVHNQVDTFVRSTGRAHSWLRAWSTWSSVHLLILPDDPPSRRSTWLPRLTHELSHCALFQHFGTPDRARKAALPFFLLEGSASVIAGQDSTRLALPRVAAALEGEKDPLPTLHTWAGRNHHVAYGAAHHALKTLVNTRGPMAIRTWLDALKERGTNYAEALSTAHGLSTATLWAMTVNRSGTKAVF